MNWIARNPLALPFALILSSATLSLQGSDVVLPNHDIERLVMDSEHAGFRYEILIGGPPESIPADKPLPLLVVLDGYLLGLSAIESARLMTAIGEIEPIVIAAVSPDGGFTVANTRRLRDMSADSQVDVASDPLVQRFMPRFKAAGLTPEEALGGSDAFRRFLADELVPEIGRRRSIDPRRVGILGHSAGGSFLIEALLEGDTPFVDYIIGEAGTFLLFGTGEDLLAKAVTKGDLPAKRAIYADSSDTAEAMPDMIAEARGLVRQINDNAGVPVKMITYEGESHTTIIPGFIKDGLLYMYGTGKTYGESLRHEEKR